MSALADRYRKILGQRSRKTITDGNHTPAAVLLLLYEKEAKPYILLTKRTETVANHKGQISLPGGSRERHDASLTHTALREAFEEVGVRCEDVDVLGLLDDCITTTSSFVITPVVGYLHYPPNMVINSQEVEEIIEIPFSFFQSAVKAQVAPQDNDPQRPCPEYAYGDHCIWGATARILEQFFSLEHSIE